MNIQIFDTVEIEDAGPGAPRYTNDGYVTARVRCARVGVQNYKGSEVGKPELEMVRVYRSPEQVFDRKSLVTYAHRPVTNDHPPVLVDADNWKKYAVGQVGDEIVIDENYVRVPMILMDKDVIKDFEAGKKQLSLGYTTEIVFDSGVTPDGQEYDAVQKDIRANHLAVVTAARGGPMLRIGDDIKEKYMKTVQLDGLPVNTDDNGAMIIDRVVGGLQKQVKDQTATIEGLQKQLSDSQTALATAQAETKKVTETKDAEIDVLKKQVADSAITPEKLDTLVKDRAEVVGKARAILGDKLVVDGKSVLEIKKQVVDAKMGDTAKNYSEDAYAASFATLTVDVKPQEQHKDSLSAALGDQAAGVNTTDVDKAWEENNRRMEGAWKTKAA